MHLRKSFFMLAIVCVCGTSVAQSPINAPGAMQPSTNTGVFHEMALYRERGADPTMGDLGADEYIALTQVAYGLQYNFSLQIDVPVVYSDIQAAMPGDDDDDFNIGDSTLLLKYRVYQNDPAPTETIRFSLIGGLQVPGNSTFRMDSSHDAWDPIVGAVFSTVLGRHGFNASFLYEFYTGGDEGMGDAFDDSLRFDASYLFRLAPAEYTDESASAWYGVLELNGFYDLNGDQELFISPGVMYEARTFTLDATVMIPVHQDLDYRAESEFLVGIGARISF
jgi:hypothetical protein